MNIGQRPFATPGTRQFQHHRAADQALLEIPNSANTAALGEAIKMPASRRAKTCFIQQRRCKSSEPVSELLPYHWKNEAIKTFKLWHSTCF